MFKTSDFFEILDYLKLRDRYEGILTTHELEVGDPITQEALDEINLDADLQYLVVTTSVNDPTPDFFWDGDIAVVTQTLADNEKVTGTKLFENTLDQPTFSSNDYKLLRKMLVDWYAANRTLISTQKNVSDLYSMPPDHMEELLKSFGYNIKIDAMDQQTRAEFFKSLVSLYKKKGTIDTLTKALEFYGYIDADVIEYWLKKTESGSLVFSPERSRRQSGSFLIDYDIPYASVTGGDPHWLATESWILSQDAANKINLPSKSPYFSLVASFSIDYAKSVLAIYQRVIHDQHDEWVSSGYLPNDVILRGLETTASILEAHLCMLFVFEQLYPEDYTTTDTNFYIYNVDSGNPFPLGSSSAAINDYVQMVSVPPTSRDDRTSKLQTIWDEWTRPLSTSMLEGTDAGAILDTMNPALKDACQQAVDTGTGLTLLTNLVATITSWMRLNISGDAPNLIVFLLGYNFDTDITKIINFFKPYRARMIATDGTYVISDKLGDYVILAEQNLYTIYQDIIDIFNIDDYVETTIVMDPFAEDFLCCLPPNYDGNSILQFDGNDNLSNPFCFDNMYCTDDFHWSIVQTPTDNLLGTGGRFPQESRELIITDESSVDTIVVNDAINTTSQYLFTSILHPYISTTTQSYNLDGSGNIEYMEQTSSGYPNVDEGWSFDSGLNSYGFDSVNIYVDHTPGPASVPNTSFASPGSAPYGLAFDSSTGNLLSVDAGNPGTVYVHYGISSTILNSFVLPGSSTGQLAITIANGNLVAANYNDNLIRVFDGISDSVIDSFATPSTGCRAITFDGANLITSCTGSTLVYIHDGISASTTSSFDPPTGEPYGLDFDGTNLLSASSADNFYRHVGITVTTDLTFALVGGASTGITWDGTNLISCDNVIDEIYVHNGMSEFSILSGTISITSSTVSDLITNPPEDWLTFVENDVTANAIDVTSNKITLSEVVVSGEYASVYKDYGVDYFGVDFQHGLEVKVTNVIDTIDKVGIVWALMNSVISFGDPEATSGLDDYGLGLQLVVGPSFGTGIRLIRRDSVGTIHTGATIGLFKNVDYYITVVMNIPNETIDLYVYTDESKTNLLDANDLSVPLVDHVNHRYLYDISHLYVGNTEELSCEISNLKI